MSCPDTAFTQINLTIFFLKVTKNATDRASFIILTCKYSVKSVYENIFDSVTIFFSFYSPQAVCVDKG